MISRTTLVTRLLTFAALLPHKALCGVVLTSPQYNCVVKNAESEPGLCHYCYTQWEQVAMTGSINATEQIIIKQGCFNYDGPQDAAEECLRSDCVNIIDDDTYEQGLRFCCCIGDFCNSRFKNSDSDLDQIEEMNPNQSSSVTVVLGFSLGFVALVLYVIVLSKIISRCKLVRFLGFRDTTSDDTSFGEPEASKAKISIIKQPLISPQSHQIDFSDFVLDETMILGNGSFGSSLYRASSGSKSFAVLSVKVFTQSQKQGFFNERDVYETIEHAASKTNGNIKYAFLQYYGTKEKVTLHDGSAHDYMIGLEHNSRGFLSDYLLTNTISWPDLCKMLTSITNGLSFLHSGFGSHKTPSFCHRDLSSRSVLVRSDLSCCICNFEKSAVLGAVREEDSNFPLPYEIGTPRYLSPEALDNTLNSQPDVESLKQIDVYALGLVFWELSRRCNDLYQGVPVPSFELAFNQELKGCSNPSLDQMKILVARRKARPLFPEVWKNSNPAVQQLRETIEYSWDHDGEARVTAICILERLRELNGLWNQYMSSRVACNNLVNKSNRSRQSTIVFQSNQLELKNNIESMLRNEETSVVKNDNVLSQQMPLQQLQPHQGRNPCLERNYDIISDAPLNAPLLVERSVKDRQVTSHQNLPSSLVEHRLPPASRILAVAHPIPYLQNNFDQLEEEVEPCKGRRRRRFALFKKTTDEAVEPVHKHPKSNNVNFERERQQLLHLEDEQPSCSRNLDESFEEELT